MPCLLIVYIGLVQVAMAIVAVTLALGVSAIPRLNHRRDSLISSALGMAAGGLAGVIACFFCVMGLVGLCEVLPLDMATRNRIEDGFGPAFVVAYGVGLVAGAVYGWRSSSPPVEAAARAVWMHPTPTKPGASEQRDGG